MKQINSSITETKLVPFVDYEYFKQLDAFSQIELIKNLNIVVPGKGPRAIHEITEC